MEGNNWIKPNVSNHHEERMLEKPKDMNTYLYP